MVPDLDLDDLIAKANTESDAALRRVYAEATEAHMATSGWEPDGPPELWGNVFHFKSGRKEATYVKIAGRGYVHLGALDKGIRMQLGHLFQLRVEIETRQRLQSPLLRALAVSLHDAGLSVRVAGAVLGVTGARFHELVGKIETQRATKKKQRRGLK